MSSAIIKHKYNLWAKLIANGSKRLLRVRLCHISSFKPDWTCYETGGVVLIRTTDETIMTKFYTETAWTTQNISLIDWNLQALLEIYIYFT